MLNKEYHKGTILYGASEFTANEDAAVLLGIADYLGEDLRHAMVASSLLANRYAQGSRREILSLDLEQGN